MASAIKDFFSPRRLQLPTDATTELISNDEEQEDEDEEDIFSDC